MINTSLANNQLSQPVSSWYLGDYLDAMDALDIDRYSTFLADDVEIRFNNANLIFGKQAAVEMLTSYWTSFKSIEHEPLNILGTDSIFVLEALNHYVRHDGIKVTTRAVAITERNATGLVKSVRIFADMSPVFA